MYSLDVNFLKDRPEFRQETRKPKQPVSVGNWTPLFIGLAAGILLPVLAAAGWWVLENQNGQLEQQIAEVDAELNRLGIQEGQLKKIQAETNQVNAETQALASVFNQIKPWSAMLRDLQVRIPRGVRIEEIKQTPPPAAPQGQPSPNPAGGISISGIARTFNDVNDFLLTLQGSPFLKDTETKIVTAELVDNPVQLPPAANGLPVKLPPVVKYTVQSSISDVPASELLRELERNGTSGLVTRIRTLQQKGIIQK